MKDMNHIGTITLQYGTGDTVHGGIFVGNDSIYITYLRRPTGLEKTTAYETGTIRSYNCLNAMFWDQISQSETEIAIVPDEDFTEQWLNFACEEWVNTYDFMTEEQRRCFLNLMASCLSITL